MSSSSRGPRTHGDILNNPLYFKSPLETLRHSTVAPKEMSSHDLMEAYSLFSSRTKAIAKALSATEDVVAALSVISPYSESLVQCLRRDIRRVMVDPDPLQHGSWFPESVTSSNGNIDEENPKRARDVSMICHYALQVLSDIFRFSALSSLFSAADLVRLADDVIGIVHAPSLPFPNERKTRSLAIWVLSNLRLPEGSLATRKYHLKGLFRYILESNEDDSRIIDSLKALLNLLELYPSTFLEPFTPLLPLVLDRLVSPSLLVQTEAAHALGAYAAAMISCSSTSYKRWRTEVRDYMRTFMDKSTAEHPTSALPMHRLGDILKTALQSSKSPTAGQGQPWALVVLACIVVLSGSGLFTHPPTLILVFACLKISANHERRTVRALHTHVWRCLVWAFSYTRNGQDRIAGTNTLLSDLRERAFNVVNQERRRGVALFLITCLLSSRSNSKHNECVSSDPEDFAHALIVVGDMIQDRNEPIHREGRAVLTRLVSSIGSPTVSSSTTTTMEETGPRILLMELFDGTILRMKEVELERHLSSIGQTGVEGLKALSEDQISRHWDGFLNLWMLCVRRAIFESEAIQGDLLHVWQALLLVRAQLTQENGHLTSPPEFAQRVVSIISEITQIKPSSASSIDSESGLQLALLVVIKQLWTVLKNVFGASWIASTAGSVLTVVLNLPCDFAREDVKTAWGELCAVLISASTPELLYKIIVRSECQNEVDLKRYLWSVLAKSWQSSQPGPPWDNSASLLAFPFGLWSMSQEELALWDDLLEFALECNDSVPLSPAAAIQALSRLVVERSQRLSVDPRATIILLSHLHLNDSDSVPVVLLSYLNDFLHDLYGHRQEFLLPALDTFGQLRDLFMRCPNSQLVAVLAALSPGICIWICDESEVLPEDDYNNVIMCLYRNTLDLLRQVPFSGDTLNTLTPFFCSAFNRIPPPALGPVAFREFWDHIRPQVRYLNGAFPVEIKQILRSHHEAFGESLPSDVSYNSEFPSPSQEEVIPETPLLDVDLSYNSFFPPALEGLNPSTKAASPGIVELSQDIPMDEAGPASGAAGVESLNNGVESLRSVERSPKSPDAAKARASSVNISSYVPFLQDSTPRLRGSSADPRLHASSAPSASGSRSPSPSILLPSSPTTGKRVLHVEEQALEYDLSALIASARPLKRPRQGSVDLGAAPQHSRDRLLSSTTRRVQRSSDSRKANSVSRTKAQRGTGDAAKPRTAGSSKWTLDYVEVPTLAEVHRRRSDSTSQVPRSGPPARQLSPEVPLYEHLDAVQQRSRKNITSEGGDEDQDDSANWEAAEVDPAEVQRMQLKLTGASDHNTDSVDGQPSSSQLVERELHGHQEAAGGKASSTSLVSSMIVPSSEDESEGSGSFPRIVTERSHTVPAGSSSSSSRPLIGRVAVPLHGSHTPSVRLEALRKAYEALKEHPSQLQAEEILAAKEIIRDMDIVLTERLIQGLAGAEAGKKTKRRDH